MAENTCEKLVCVIVTYNRLALLKETLNAVRNQTTRVYRVVIVNNNSTDGTKDYLSEIRSQYVDFVEVLNLPVNTGGAGGFNAGIGKAMSLNPDWVWVMDDDCVCSADALRELVNGIRLLKEKTGSAPGFVCSQVLWKDDSVCLMNIPVPNWRWNDMEHIMPGYTKLRSCSFVSCLIGRAAVLEVGLPVSEFFIWYDDVEYTMRISDHFDCFHVPSSIVHHHLPKNVGYDFAQLNGQNLWKFRYAIRNHVSVLAYRHGFRILPPFRHLVNEICGLIRHKKSLRIIFQMAWAGFGGLFFNYKKHIRNADIQ